MSIQLVAAIQGRSSVETHARSMADATPHTILSSEAESASKVADPTAKQLQEAIDTIHKAVGTATNELDFSIDEGSGRTVVKVIDKTTNEVIRQFPSKEVLQIAQALDKLQGLLIKEEA
jgi:flagellar protein FlaG